MYFCFIAWQVFSKLKQHDKEEKFRHKIVPIEGDCSLPGLGISESDRRKLIENVQIIFHAAATVRFDEKLKLALAINVNGTKEIMLLSKAAKSLVVRIHIIFMFTVEFNTFTEFKKKRNYLFLKFSICVGMHSRFNCIRQLQSIKH